MEDDPPVVRQTASLDELRSGARSYLVLNSEIESAEETLNALKQKRYKLETEDLVDLMREIDTITVDGFSFTPGTHYHASIPKDSREAAHDWLEADGSGDIIKYTVSAEFPRDSEADVNRLKLLVATRVPDEEVEDAKKILDAAGGAERFPGIYLLMRRGAPGFPDARVSSDRAVPWARLTSWFKERMLNLTLDPVTGKTDAPPLEILGASVTQRVAIKPVKNRN